MRHENLQLWSAEEDDRMIALVRRHGQRWSKILTEFPGRTTASLRNRWARLKAFDASRTRLCRRCGAPRRVHICRGLEGRRGAFIGSSMSPERQNSPISTVQTDALLAPMGGAMAWARVPLLPGPTAPQTSRMVLSSATLAGTADENISQSGGATDLCSAFSESISHDPIPISWDPRCGDVAGSF